MKRIADHTVAADSAGVVGFIGTIACAGAMVLAAAGAIGVGASVGVAGMGLPAPAEPGPLANIVRFLLDAGAAILVVWAGAITLSLALRRGSAAVPVLLGGAILYRGMSVQASLPVMDLASAAGFLIWIATAIWMRGARRRDDQANLT